jgi:hypothetical protein
VSTILSSGPSTSTASGSAQLIPVNYITISGPLPETPFFFDDGVVLKTEEELKKMDISSLMMLTSTLSTSISLQTSTVLANKNIQGVYSILTGLSQSTIDGLDSEIATNISLIAGYTDYANYLDAVSTSYISTLQDFDRDIEAQMELINQYNSSLSSYATDYIDTVSTLEKENTDFNIAATNYSTIYYIYLGYKQQYHDKTSTLSVVNDELSTAVMKEQVSYRTLQQSTRRWLGVSKSLSSLYDDRISIGSTLTQYRLDEINTYLNYESSITVFSTISSMYSAAVANEIYALSLSTTTQKVTDYTDALQQFQAADLLYNNSVPQAGGGASGSILGNSALWAARSMANQRLQAIQAEKIAAENATASLLNLAGLANTSAYETILLAYDSQILSYGIAEEKFKNYKLSSLEAVAKFSSIYEQSVLDIAMYTEQISMYSSMYVSSLIGASSLLGYSELEQSTILSDTLTYNAISWSISTLNDNYSTSMSNYLSTIELSSILAAEYYTSMSNIDIYTSLYTSSQTALDAMVTQLYGPGGLVSVYNNTVFTNSSILNKELLNTKGYNAQIREYINLQDMSMYEYRETYCRSQRLVYQAAYESNVFVAVQLAQSITASNQARAAAGTTVNPVAADLTVPVISNSYAQLNSINTFLTAFSDIYTTYDSQYSNIKRLSTSIGYETAAWSTVDYYTKAEYFSTPMISSINTLVTRSCDAFAGVQDSTTALLATYARTQSTIDLKKVGILSSLALFFSPVDIQAQTDTISSFLIQSIADATTMLESQGAILTV